jgi:phage terminase large subunit-like protein
VNLSTLSRPEKVELLKLLEERDRRRQQRRIDTFYPDDGPLRRELYPKHLEFFAASLTHKQVLALAANRVGKTEGMGAYATAVHLTGRYPAWWPGRRFERPIKAWVAGKTNETTGDIVQAKLLGAVQGSGHTKRLSGTGMVRGDCIGDVTWKQGSPDLVDTVRIRHVSGEWSTLGVKSYQQGRGSFEGTEQDLIWLDEEPPLEVYTEALVRLMTTDGLMLCTFTPLEGLSDVVLSFLPGGKLPEDGGGALGGSRYVVMATWADVPHLSDEQQAILLASIPPYQRDARTKGIPQLGSGAIYPVPESEIVVDPFELPRHWRRSYAMDVGWNRTAAVWGAVDPDTDTAYITHEHYRGQDEPASHAAAVRARGEWMLGVIDPAARGRGQKDGESLMQQYQDLGLTLIAADHGVEAGLFDVFTRLTTGKLKVFRTCQNWLAEYRLYRRDEKGHIVKVNDHLMDATRYWVRSGLVLAATEPARSYGGGVQAVGREYDPFGGMA